MFVGLGLWCGMILTSWPQNGTTSKNLLRATCAPTLSFLHHFDTGHDLPRTHWWAAKVRLCDLDQWPPTWLWIYTWNGRTLTPISGFLELFILEWDAGTDTQVRYNQSTDHAVLWSPVHPLGTVYHRLSASQQHWENFKNNSRCSFSVRPMEHDVCVLSWLLRPFSNVSKCFYLLTYVMQNVAL